MRTANTQQPSYLCAHSFLFRSLSLLPSLASPSVCLLLLSCSLCRLLTHAAFPFVRVSCSARSSSSCPFCCPSSSILRIPPPTSSCDRRQSAALVNSPIRYPCTCVRSRILLATVAAIEAPPFAVGEQVGMRCPLLLTCSSRWALAAHRLPISRSVKGATRVNSMLQQWTRTTDA